jgi:tRNA-2-methylthio-N6-dimethylallyladenosine synthase
VRVSYLQPAEVRPGLIEVMTSTPGVAQYFDLSFQHASGPVLRRMRRFGDRERFCALIEQIRQRSPEAGIRSNFIVGFPGETEADFEQTLSLLEEVGYDGVFSFKYSPRPNTPALTLDDAIPDQEKARRLEILMSKQRELQTKQNKKHIGDICEVMVEGRNQARAQWIGRTSQNKTLNFTAPQHTSPKVGTYTQVTILSTFPNSLLGEMVV